MNNINTNNINDINNFIPSSIIWGPHYWYVLHTITRTYPINPTNIDKKKYYEFIHNIPLFIPDSEMRKQFITILDQYPVSPYLDTRITFMKWMNFIHNRINEFLHKDTISFKNSITLYHDYHIYHPSNKNNIEKYKFKSIYSFVSYIQFKYNYMKKFIHLKRGEIILLIITTIIFFIYLLHKDKSSKK